MSLRHSILILSQSLLLQQSVGRHVTQTQYQNTVSEWHVYLWTVVRVTTGSESEYCVWVTCLPVDCCKSKDWLRIRILVSLRHSILILSQSLLLQQSVGRHVTQTQYSDSEPVFTLTTTGSESEYCVWVTCLPVDCCKSKDWLRIRILCLSDMSTHRLL
jgi:hypothetical protein